MADNGEIQKKTGTPIPRGVGFIIRVGWSAKAYRVSHAVHRRYRMYSALLFILAVLVGVGVSMGAEYLLFEYVVPLVNKVHTVIKDHPQIFRLMIYLSTLVLGGLIYLHLRGKVGAKLVGDAVALDEGSSFKEQRRRSALARKRAWILVVLLLAVVLFAPLGLKLPLQTFLAIIPAYFLAEGIYFKFNKST